MLGYDNGPLTVLANWSRLADSKKSYVWNLGGAYDFGPARVSLAYEQTMDKGWKEGEISIRSKQQTWLLGLEMAARPGASECVAELRQSQGCGLVRNRS